MTRAVLSLVLLMLTVGTNAAAAETGTLRFGLTAVVVRENLRLFDRWADYLAVRIGRPVAFVQRRSYKEIMELLESGELDAAWICGYPFVRERDPEFLDLLVVPLFEGAPIYRSYVIVPRDSPHRRLEDLEGRVFAFSDPDSNSGYLVPLSLLAARGRNPADFFRLTLFTYSHAETVEAVADQVVDGGAVDSYVWEFLRKTRPELTDRTRVLLRSPPFGFPPIVVRREIDPALRARLLTALTLMSAGADGRALLAELALDGFGVFSPGLYDSIRVMAGRLAGLSAARQPVAAQAIP